MDNTRVPEGSTGGGAGEARRVAGASARDVEGVCRGRPARGVEGVPPSNRGPEALDTRGQACPEPAERDVRDTKEAFDTRGQDVRDTKEGFDTRGQDARDTTSRATVRRGTIFPALLRNETVKALRRKLPYFGLFMGGLICVLTYVVADEIGTANTANAWGYVTLSMQLVFADIGLIFVLVFAAMLMADEARSGTIRAALAAPLYRWEFYLGKAVTGLLYMMAMSAVCLVLSILLARVHYRFGPVADSLGEIYSAKTVLANFLLAWVLSWVPLAAIVFYGLFLSTIIRSSGAAVAASIGTLYVIDFTKHVVGLDPYIFTRYIVYPWQIFGQIAQGVDCQWRPEIWKMLGLCGVYGAATFAAGLVLFLRQDLNE